MIDRISRDLLGRHVPRRADHDRRVRGQAEHSRDSEIQNLQAAGSIDHQVGGLDVAMDELHLVGIPGARAELFHPSQLVRERDRVLAADEAGECFASDILHDDEWLRVVFAEVVDRNDIGMAERSGGARLARESLARVGQIEIAGEYLDRDHSTENGVVGDVYRTHAPSTESSLDFVPPDLGTWLEH